MANLVPITTHGTNNGAIVCGIAFHIRLLLDKNRAYSVADHAPTDILCLSACIYICVGESLFVCVYRNSWTIQ